MPYDRSDKEKLNWCLYLNHHAEQILCDGLLTPGLDVCETCYEKDSKEDNQGDPQRNLQAGVEIDKDSLPK